VDGTEIYHSGVGQYPARGTEDMEWQEGSSEGSDMDPTGGVRRVCRQGLLERRWAHILEGRKAPQRDPGVGTWGLRRAWTRSKGGSSGRPEGQPEQSPRSGCSTSPKDASDWGTKVWGGTTKERGSAERPASVRRMLGGSSIGKRCDGGSCGGRINGQVRLVTESQYEITRIKRQIRRYPKAEGDARTVASRRGWHSSVGTSRRVQW
jgi:hypothetical protein